MKLSTPLYEALRGMNEGDREKGVNEGDRDRCPTKKLRKFHGAPVAAY